MIQVKFVVALAVLATSCSSNIDDFTAENNAKDNLVPLTLTASQETGIASRTALAKNGSSINWTIGDQIMVCDGKDWHPFTALQGGSSSTSLEGSVCSGSTSFSAYYMGSSLNEKQNSITVTLPTEQTATVGSFDPKANLMYATSTTSQNLSFKNCCSYLKLTTKREYTKIVITTDQDISGVGTANEGTYKFVLNESSSSKSVTLVPASGETAIAAGTYYIAIAPVTAKSVITDCYTSDTKYDELALTSTAGFTLARGQINSLGSTSDNGWKYDNSLPNGSGDAPTTAHSKSANNDI